MSIENGIHHVLKGDFKRGDKYFCGRTISDFDFPLTIEHAKGCIAKGTYVQPCRRCMKIAQKIKR